MNRIFQRQESTDSFLWPFFCACRVIISILPVGARFERYRACMLRYVKLSSYNIWFHFRQFPVVMGGVCNKYSMANSTKKETLNVFVI